ncbi:MAG: metallophosphoesterase family protein [Vulcanimicrobiaceae bacterium]
MAVVSDTHVPRFAARLDAALARVAAERPEIIIHCGDLTDLGVIAAFEAIAPVRAVAGNNDGPEVVARFGRRAIVRVAGVAIGAVHGDGQRGTTLGRARAAFAREPVDAIVFGHSHIPYCERHDGVWVVNPGSPTDKRRQPVFSFAMLEIAAGACTPRIVVFGPCVTTMPAST